MTRMTQPTFPFTAKPGQYVFFREIGAKDLSYCGRIKGKRGNRWEVQTFNSTHNITFCAVTGLANPFGTQLRLCWLGDDTYVGMHYEDAIARATKEMKNEHCT